MSGWKKDESGNIILKEGNPVYVDDNNVEKTVLPETITRLGGEAKQNRIAKEEALEKLKKYEGIDAEKAKEALETVEKLGDNKLIESGKLDELKNQINQQFQTQIAEKDSSLKDMQTKYDSMIINNTFANSEFIRGNVSVPHDMFEATFRKNFKVEDGKVAVYGKDGNRLLSKENAGEYATPEEGLKILAESHSQAAVILKANNGSGTGNNGAGGATGGGRYLKRSEFAKLSPRQQSDTAKKIELGELKLTD